LLEGLSFIFHLRFPHAWNDPGKEYEAVF